MRIDHIGSILVTVDAGEILRNTRRDRGLTQSELARRAGTTQTYISRIERGAVSPSLSTLERLLCAMGRRLIARVEPLPPGNASVTQLRADVRGLTASQRVAQATELSSFTTGLAAVDSTRPARGD
jgi:transcriptional regulator with XRE-family HTH domain